MPDVTLLEIARRLGVSKTAVSLALRGKPGLAEATNHRIHAMARELGYVPNPVSVELMALVRAKRHNTGAQTIAFINTFRDTRLFRRVRGFMEFVVGAKARAARFGYTLEVFDARVPGMTGARLADILQARGIRGVLVGPRWEQEPELEFPWERFACVLVGEPEYGPNLHRVCNHHIHGCATVLRRLAAKGYRRIGVALAKPHEMRYGHDYVLGVEQFRRSEPGAIVETLLYDDWTDDAGEAWIREHAFDAIVSLSDHPLGVVERLCGPRWERLGFASLSRQPGQRYSGIDQHTEEIGAAAVDLLRALLLDGERGAAPRPRILLVEGEWVEGETTPGPRAGAGLLPRKPVLKAGRAYSSQTSAR